MNSQGPAVRLRCYDSDFVNIRNELLNLDVPPRLRYYPSTVGRTLIWLHVCSTLACAQIVHLVSPDNGAKISSSYVTIEGEAKALGRVEILDGGVMIASVPVNGAGRFERVLHLSAGSHEIHVQCGSSKSTVRVETSGYPASQSPAPYELLQTGDVILAHGQNSSQDALYRPVYTHAALYIGPDAKGAPRLLEAVTEEDASAEGPVATVTIEQGLAWRTADRVDLFRIDGGLGSEDRIRIVEWARRTAALGLPFRTSEFGDVYRAWLLWDPRTDRPRDAAEFKKVLAELRARLQASDTYDCATLVWHAYLDNTAHHINLASPNRAVWRGALGNVSGHFAAALRPLAILPDSLAFSGKLRRVGGE